MIVVKKDGRKILTGKHYSDLREEVYLRDKGLCHKCRRRVSLVQWGADSDMHLHHTHGRGMGGGRRNDIPEECETLCARCHRETHNQ